MPSRIAYFIIFVLILSSLVSADSLYESVILKSGNVVETPKTYVLNENTYTFDLVYCNVVPPWARIRVNDNPISFFMNDSYNLDDNFYIKIDVIDPQRCDNQQFCHLGYEGYCLVGFSIFSRSEIVKVVPLCEPNTYGCCQGKWVDPHTDNNNCGICGNKCAEEEKCIQSYCKTYCGNGLCDGKETCSSCVEDCGCKEGFNCSDNFCRPLDECSTEAECNDQDLSTRDICFGYPLRCKHIKIKDCISNDNYCPSGCTRELDRDCLDQKDDIAHGEVNEQVSPPSSRSDDEQGNNQSMEQKLPRVIEVRFMERIKAFFKRWLKFI